MESVSIRGVDVDGLADVVVAASAAGEPDPRAVAELCRLCEAAGLDHEALLDEAVSRAQRAA
jgi:hypothetical protein